MYSKETIKRFRKPKFAGRIKNADAVGEEGGFKCGDMMRVYLKVKKGNKKGIKDEIKDIKFETYGCVAAISSTDMMCELVKGKTLEEAYKMPNKEIVNSLGEMPEIKIHCSILGMGALRKAIDNYRKKSG